MLSDRFYKWFGRSISILGPRCGAIPYGWNYGTRTLTSHESAKRKLKVTYALILLWELFFISRIIRFRKMNDINQFNLTYAFAVGTTVPIFAGSFLLYFTEEIKEMVNKTLGLMHHMNDTYQPYYDRNSCRRSRILEFIVFSISAGLGGTVFVINATIVCFPRFSIFWGSLIHGEDIISKVVLVISAIFQMHTANVIYVILGFPMILMVIYGTIMVSFVVTEFQLGRKTYKTLHIFRNPDHLRLNYRIFQIFNQLVMGIIGYLLVPLQTVLGHIIIFCSFTFIRHYQRIDTFSAIILVAWSIIASIFWAFALTVGGSMYLSGGRTLHSWKTQSGSWDRKTRKEMSKFRKSCLPILVSWNKTFKIKPLTSLKFFKGVSKGICSALMTISDSDGVAENDMGDVEVDVDL